MTRMFLRGIGPSEWTFRLPVPPSLNMSYPTVPTKNGGFRRVASSDLQAFWLAASRALMTQKRPIEPIRGKFHAHFRCERRPGDLDNRKKHAIDMMKRGGVIADDRQYEGGTEYWDDEIEGCTLTIEVLA